MSTGVIHCRDAGGRTPFIYKGAPDTVSQVVAGCRRLLQIVAASDHAEFEAEVSGKSLKYWG